MHKLFSVIALATLSATGMQTRAEGTAASGETQFREIYKETGSMNVGVKALLEGREFLYRLVKIYTGG